MNTSIYTYIHIAVCCSVLQCVQCVSVWCSVYVNHTCIYPFIHIYTHTHETHEMTGGNCCDQKGRTYRSWATNCNMLTHTDTHCNALKHAATRCNTLLHTAKSGGNCFEQQCWTSRSCATHCNILQHKAAHCKHTATRCNTLRHTATSGGNC